MAKNTVWQDDYWLPVMQLYLKKPVGVKATYCREMVELSLELHVAPPALAHRMQQIAKLSTPRVEHFWQTYSGSPERLKRAVSLWREMRGFGYADAFYEGVDLVETFERDFRPLDEEPSLTPVSLILILDLYFRLTPITMVSETPEVKEMAKPLKVEPSMVVSVLDLYQLIDPYLNRKEISLSPLLLPCQEIWQRFGNDDLEHLAEFAKELRAFYDSLG